MWRMICACDPFPDSRINAEVSPLKRYVGLVFASVLLIKSLLSQHSLDLRQCKYFSGASSTLWILGRVNTKLLKGFWRLLM